METGWLLAGGAVFAFEGAPCQLSYEVICDSVWRTVSAAVDGWMGSEAVSVRVEVEADGRWSLNGAECSAVAGCIDIDLNFSPSTNLLPIRRLTLAVGEEDRVRAAWLRFPEFTLEPLEQVYRRTSADRYCYISGGGSFERELKVNELGFVTDYPGFWAAEAVRGG